MRPRDASVRKLYQKIADIYAIAIDRDLTARLPNAFSPRRRTSCTRLFVGRPPLNLFTREPMPTMPTWGWG
jgi:hypothetical protein